MILMAHYFMIFDDIIFGYFSIFFHDSIFYGFFSFDHNVIDSLFVGSTC